MLKPGLTATLSLPQYPDKQFKASFQTTANAFDPQTRTVVTELTVDNPDHAIWPGTYTNVRFTTGADPTVLIVPEQALDVSCRGHAGGPRPAGWSRPPAEREARPQPRPDGTDPRRSEETDRLIDNPSAGLLEGEQVNMVAGAPGIAPAPEFKAPQDAKTGDAPSAGDN